MSKKNNEPRCFNVSVVGLSGLDRDQSLYGVGKSCLCNRFVRPLADDYITEHTSVFSASDFNGRVINNDQFLFWGSIAKPAEDGTQVFFQVFEQTEFIDDSNLVPLSRGGQLVPYPKRCASTKLTSHEKLMYISRDQVALQNDYTQISLPGGKVTIDGFLVLFDVEASHAKRLEDQQERFLSAALSYIQKTKKPYVVVATKCDDTQLNLLQEAHRFAQSKKINVPVIETSAHQNVNVELAFVVLSQLIERGKVRSKILPFNEAQKIQKELVDRTINNYQGLINRTVADFRVIWKNTKKVVEEKQEFTEYRDLCGLDACKKLFNKHIRRLRKEYEDRRFNEYLLKLPNALDELLPNISSLELYHWNWQNCQKAIRKHKEFSKWMIVLPTETAWNESDHLLSDDLRIPFDVLETEDAGKVFELHVGKLKAAEKRARMKNEFRKLLQLTPQIRPGAQWLEAAVLLQNEESYQYLEDNERCAIFDLYVREIGEQAKVDFQELLFESAALFTKLGPSVRPSDQDVQRIKDTLSTDDRYKRLEKLVSVRDILLLNHIALLHSPTRCLCGPEKCRDRLMQEIVATTNNRPNFMGSDETLDSEDSQLNLLLLGTDGLAQELEKEIQAQCSDGDSFEYVLDGRMYEIDLRVVDGDAELSDYTISDSQLQGVLCVYSSPESLEYVSSCLAEMFMKGKYDSLDESLQNGLPPITVMLTKTMENEEIIHHMRKMGQEVAERYNGIFIDVPVTHYARIGRVIHESQVVDSIRAVVEKLKQQSSKNSSSDDLKDTEPDLKIMLCAMCGDPYPVELIFGPLLHHQNCWRSPTRPDAIILETLVGYEKRRVMITLSSYHRAYSLNYQQFHGYILVYSAVRKASLATLSGFSASIPNVPIQVLAVTGSASGASVVFHSDVAASLLADGSNLASKLSAKFQTTSPHFQQQAGAFAAFFNQAWDRKGESEEEYALFLEEQNKRLALKQKNEAKRELPELPAEKQQKTKPRRRYPSERLSMSPKIKRRLHENRFSSQSQYEDPDIAPYAEFNAVKNNMLQLSHSSEDLQHPSPYATSTPNAFLANNLHPGADNASTPLSCLEWEKREVNDSKKKEDIYAKVDLSRKPPFRKSRDTTMDDSEVNLIENSLYANKNLAQSQRSSGSDLRNTPPPLPERGYLSSNFGFEVPTASRTDTINTVRSQDDEGYSTIQTDHEHATTRRAGDRRYEEVQLQGDRKTSGQDDGGSTQRFEEIQSPLGRKSSTRTDSNSGHDSFDPYTMSFNSKLEFFNKKNIDFTPVERNMTTDVWVRRDEISKQPGSRTSYPNVSRQPSFGPRAPLAQQEFRSQSDMDEPEYAQVTDVMRAMTINDNRPAGLQAPSQPAHGKKNQAMKPARSAEDIPTLEHKKQKEKFFLSRSRHRSRDESRGTIGSITSDGGTGDELTLPHSHDRAVKKRLSARIRSRHSSRSPFRRNNRAQSIDDDSLPREEGHRKSPKVGRSKSVKKEGSRNSHLPDYLRLNADSSQDDDSSNTSSLESKHRNRIKNNLLPQSYLSVSPKEEVGESDMNTEPDTEDEKTPKKTPSVSDTRSLKRGKTREKKEAEKARKKEEKKAERLKKEEERKRKKLEKKQRDFIKKKHSQLSPSMYFGRPLEEVCVEGTMVPLFVDKCIDYVESVGMPSEGIYRVSGNNADIRLFEKKFEENPNMTISELGVGVHAVTGALKSFFKKLPVPLIPSNHHSAILESMVIMEANNRLAILKALLRDLTPHRLAVLKRLMFHLNRVAEHSKENLMEPRSLAVVIFPTLFRPDFTSFAAIGNQMNMGLFIQTCIEKCEYLFEDAANN